MLYKSITTLVFTLVIRSVFAQLTYPGPQFPADTPQLFAKGILSDGLSNRDFTISPAGDEIFYTLQHPKFITSTILHLIKKNGKWEPPEVAPFSGYYRDLEASFSPDGQTIYFSSDRPVKENTDKKDFDIWKVRRLTGGGWSKPEHLGMTVNTNKNEFYPSVAKNGNLYFTVEAPYGKGKEDIVMCTWTKDGYNAPVSLPGTINTANYEFNAVVDPGEKFILFTSYGREDDLGNGDLYISYSDKNGNWMAAKHLPAPINTSALDYCPFVTWDKKYLIFTSNRINPQLAHKKLKSYNELNTLLADTGNGLDDIYWVKFNVSW